MPATAWRYGSRSPRGKEKHMTRMALALASLLLLGGALPTAARVLHVKPGDSIQAAVDQASSGDIVMIAPATYHEAGRPCPTEPGNMCAVVVDKDGITLMADRKSTRLNSSH